MKLAIYISGMRKGGTERKVANLANYMSEKGHDVVLVNAYRFDDEFAVNESVKRLTCEPDATELPGSRIGNYRARFNALKDIWLKERPDAILSFIGKTNIMTLLTSKGLGIPVAVGVAGDPNEEYYSPVLKFLARNLFKRADAVILQTKRSMSFFPEKVRNKAVIMRNPVSADFDIDRYEGERDKTVVTLGRIDENKNHSLIIDAFAEIADKYPEWKVIIYGEGPLKETLEDRVKGLGLSDKILFPGYTNDVVGVLKKAGVFVLSSNTEGSPNALIEAMMLGVPVISTDCPCGGPGELIRDGENGLLIPVNDRAKMQESLQKIFDNCHFSDQIGRKSSATRDIYSPKKVFGAWEELLTNLANKGKVNK
ncbi:MAG: glycosyltransferase [Lachnospiraceae bacterium]|nr:glycosyltransferase [Lachnospiraceae bacterium]